jgi:sarcosine oxidase
VTRPTRPGGPAAALPTDAADLPATTDLLVVGAGVMGAWTAYFAAAGGARRVTLLDAFGTGHPRATSGDETRILRAAHGPDGFYTRWSRRARDLWLEYGEAWGVPLLLPTGVLWFTAEENAYEARSAETLQAHGVPFERLSPADVAARWPQISTEHLAWALYEPEGGTLMARRGCQAATRAFQEAGGHYGLASVRAGRAIGGRLLDVAATDGRRWSAGTFVFACGPWLHWLFPEQLGSLIRVTKQDVIYVGPARGDGRFRPEAMPSWVEYGRAYYGVPAVDDRGFKLAPDRYGPVFDPSGGERLVDPDTIRLARLYLAERFPALVDAPVVETRVCQYETTPDSHFILDRLPGFDNVWIAGGGSGHGYKHGPRIGQYLVARLDGAALGAQDGPEEARFQLGPRTADTGSRTMGDTMADDWLVV